MQSKSDETFNFSITLLREMLKNSKRVLSIVWKEKRVTVIAMGVIFTLLATMPFLVSGARGLLINELIRVTQGQSSSLVWLLAAAVIFASVTPSMLMIWQNYLSRLFWLFLEEKFEILILKRKGEIDVASHENPKQSDLFNKVNESGIYRVQNYVDRQFYLLQNVIEVIVASIILLFAQWWVFLIILAGTIPELIIEMKYGREVWGIWTARAEVRRRYWDLRGHFDALPSLIELKLFQNTRHFVGIIKDLFGTFQDEQRVVERKKLWRELAVSSLSQIVIAFAVIWFIAAVIRGEFLIGTFTFILASIGELRQSLSSLFSNLGKQYSDSLFVKDVFALIDTKPALVKSVRGHHIVPNHTPTIEFKNVSFAYPGTDKLVLKNISFTIPPGEKLAIIGINGAGKTTLVKLLCRFYDPTKGQILVDGVDLKEINLESWYGIMGALFQDYAQYRFLVRDSIGVGRSSESLSLDKVKDAARSSESHMFIEEWEKTYDQMLGKQFSEGVEPSVGQWQKLALARVFYRDPRIIILDEPTSSIDAEAEAKIFGKVENLPSDRTVLLISHRFSTVRRATKIAVIENGTISEYGSHEELLKKAGTYARLFALQAKAYN